MNRKLIKIVLLVIAVCAVGGSAQTPPSPLTSREVVALVYQLPKHPEKRDEIVEEIQALRSELTGETRRIADVVVEHDDVLVRNPTGRCANGRCP